MPEKLFDPTITSFAYNRMSKYWNLISSLLGGTPAIRRQGETFLPKHSAESQKDYGGRLANSVLTNYFKKTVGSMSGRVFAGLPVLSDDMDERIKAYCEDIDLEGRNLFSWASSCFSNALSYGMNWILVDFPNVNPEDTKTVAAEKASGARPYWVMLNASDVRYVIFNKTTRQIQMAIIREIDETNTEYGSVQKEQFRVLRIGSWQLYQKSESTKNKKNKEYELVDEGATTIDFVPLIPNYTNKVGQYEATPPLLDLAYLNIDHYQGRSNQKNALTVAQFPLLAATGFRPASPLKNAAGVPNAPKSVEVGPRKMLNSDDPQTRFYYVEHSGAAIEAGRNFLSDLVDEITTLGVQLLIPNAAGRQITATESNNRENESMSELERMANDFQDTLNLALEYTAKWINSEQPGAIALNGRFDLPNSDKDIDALLSMRATSEISRDTLYFEMKRRGVLSEQFDGEIEKEKLGQEPPIDFE